MFDEFGSGLNDVAEPMEPEVIGETEEPAPETDLPAEPSETGEQPVVPEIGGEPLSAAEASLYELLGSEISVEPLMNRNEDATIENGYTPGQCARVSSGTQNYCPFAGSGR